MMNYLNNLAIEVLRNEPSGISKVRFAKILYFIHKGLIQSKLAASEELKFIRMPLGPVPVGFKQLHNDSAILVERIESSLTYNTQIYKLKEPSENISQTFPEKIKFFIEDLRTIPTSELIEISHKEPSWIQHVNGSEYYISDEDLKLVTNSSSSKNQTINTEIDEQRIQASLVEGMLDDIVEESTSLEYPDTK